MIRQVCAQRRLSSLLATMGLLVAHGCSAKDDAAARDEPQSALQTRATPAVPTAEPPGEHGHAAPHGGAVVTVGAHHFELLPRDKSFLVYLLDMKLATLPVSGISGRVTILSGTNRYELPLAVVEDHLEATGKQAETGEFVAVVQLDIGGKTETARIAYHPLAPHAGMNVGGGTVMAHADHAPRYGGLLLMSGDHHFEVVLDRAGRHRVYLSDAVRNPVAPERVPGKLSILREGARPEELKLKPTGDHLAARGRPVKGKATARVSLQFSGADPYWIDVPFEAMAAK